MLLISSRLLQVISLFINFDCYCLQRSELSCSPEKKVSIWTNIFSKFWVRTNLPVTAVRDNVFPYMRYILYVRSYKKQ